MKISSNIFFLETANFISKTKDTAIDIVAMFMGTLLTFFKSHLGSTPIIQLWVWTLLCWTQTTAMGWNPLKSSNSFPSGIVTQKCFHFSISWIRIIYFYSAPPAFPTHLPAEEKNPQPHSEFIITTPALCQSSLRTPNKPSSMGFQSLCNFVLLFSMPGISQTA